MGEMAEMILNGLLCEGCGEFIDYKGNGCPRYCSEDCSKGQDEEFNIDPAEDASIRLINLLLDDAIFTIEIAIADIKKLKIKNKVKELSWLIRRLDHFKEKLQEDVNPSNVPHRT